MMNFESIRARLIDLPNVTAFAADAGVSSKTIFRIRGGYDQVNLSTLRKIADALQTHKRPLRGKAKRPCALG